MTPSCEEAVGGGERANAGLPEVMIRPEPAAWRGLVSRSGADVAAKVFRRELGLPDDRPVMMSGHQAQVWHPGILAKLIALDAAAGAMNAAAAWVIVDHDENDSLTVRAPYISADGRLAVQSFGPAKAELKDVPACRRAAWAPGSAWSFPAGSSEAAPGVRAGLERIRESLARNAGEADAADQTAAAAFELARPVAQTPVVVRATELARTSLFGEIFHRMREDPHACIEAHNAAVAAFPHERIAPLAVDASGAGYELPLWTVGAAIGAARRKVFSAELASLPIEGLAPRALLLTGLMRLAGCELFVHGLGGERYDRITELWLGKWLGKQLAPTAMVTATMRLRVPGCWPTEETIARAVWTSHRARHDPALVDDPARAAAKLSLVEQIRAAAYQSRERADLFHGLHALLDGHVREHAAALDALDRDAAAMKARAGEAAIATDRTWAFPLYAADQLAALREAVRARFV